MLNGKRCGLGLVLVGVMLCNTGCGVPARHTVTVEFQNLTGVEISELIVYCEACEMDTTNRLSENLAVDGMVRIDLGRYSDRELSEGFALEAVSAADGSTESFGGLMLYNGDRVSFYLDDMGLALAVNQTEEEIAAQRAKDNAMLAETE